MYGLSKQTDLAFMLGNEVLQVCIGRYQAILNCTSDLSISLECDFAGGRVAADQQLPGSAIPLLGLLGSSISRAEIVGGGDLVLICSNGEVMRIYDSSSEYESYQITAPGRHIVV